jgi:uncharacterized protein (DUF849 family)
MYCARAGAGMVHLHVRDETGEQTDDLSIFRKNQFPRMPVVIFPGNVGNED